MIKFSAFLEKPCIFIQPFPSKIPLVSIADYTKQNLWQNLRGFLLLAAVSLLLFSCTDSGCIDADDFGEYESQTITVTANARQDNCAYDSALDITDSSQGAGLKSCFTAGSTTVTDENGQSRSNSGAGGCSGFTELTYKTICINACVQQCLSSAGSSNSSGAEPTWNSTDKKGSGANSGVTLRPGSKIMVRAVGNVSLGNAVNYPEVFLRASDPRPNTNNSSFNKSFFDVRSGQALSLTFSGEVSAGSGVSLGNASPEQNLYNLTKRLVVYTTPHPENYSFDVSQSSEEQGTKGVPLLPDPRLWHCSYSGSDTLESSCVNAPYVGIYVNSDHTATNNQFPVSSAVKSSMLTMHGGAIRWSGDGLSGTDFDPFSTNGITCNSSGVCANLDKVSANQGQLIGDFSSGSVTIQNAFNDSYAIYFRSLLSSDTGCNVPLSVSIVDSSNNALYSFSPNVVHNSWTTNQISLEPGQKLVINQNSSSTTKYNGSGINCGRVIGIRFLKYHDLKIDQSGFVRFAMVAPSGGNPNGSCSIKGRIVNPSGSHVDFNGAGTADFYEYGTHESYFGDPLASIVIAASSNGSPNFSPGLSSSSNQIFVRKGQVIRLYPDSWSGTWNASASLARKCGVGMIMHVDPRPALLCRGSVSEPVSNPNCDPQLGTNGALMGCKPTAIECLTESNASYYCTRTDFCLDEVVCNDDSNPGTKENNYTRTCKFSGGSTTPTKGDSAACATALGELGLTGSDLSSAKTKCKSCSTLQLSRARQSALIDVPGVNQCYDLENYTGKVNNIPLTPSSSTDVENFLTGSFAKGAVKLGSFNGYYGNVDRFSDSGKTAEGGKKIYDITSQYIPASNSRLRLLLLDGSSFLDPSGAWTAYSDNTSPSGSYDGNNGIRVGFKGSLNFTNGQWMQVALCQESSNSDSSPSYDCKNTSITNFASANSQPEIINITVPSSSAKVGADPDIDTGGSAYKFDSSGNLVRYYAGSVPGDCTLDKQGVDSGLGTIFYCHTYQYYTESDLKSKGDSERSDINNKIQRLRLSFKILDPEIGNCNYKATNDGVKVSNPFYDKTVSANDEAVCGNSNSNADTPGDGTGANPGTCRKEYYCANKYSNNSGQYYVNVKVKNPVNGAVSSIIGAVIKPVLEVMDGKEDGSTVGQAERVYKALISDPRYKAILKVSLVLMFTFYGVGYLLGVSELNHAEVFGRILKIGFIYLMVGETGWDWFKMFFVKFFKDGTDYLSFMMASSFDDSPDIKNAIDSGNFYDKSILFSSVDDVFSLFFSSAVINKVSALFFASIFGWLYFLIIWWGFIHYVYAVANAVLLYLTAQVFISIMFVLGPIFFIFLIFNQTKDMFDNWLKQLIGFSLQQIFLLTTLAFFNMLMYEVIKMSLGFKICWDEIWVMNLYITRVSLLSFWTVASMPPRTNANSQVGNIGNPEGIPSIFTILFIWVIASLMEQFIGFMTDLASSISGGLSASSMGAGIKDGLEKMKEGFKKHVVDPQKVWDNTAGRVLDKVDDKLFNSGKTADARRAQAEAQLAQDKSNKKQMLDAGKSAASAFKKENAAKLAAELKGAKSDKEKSQIRAAFNQKANEVSKKAMAEKAEAMGLSEKETKRLMNDKGVKTGGSETVLGAARNILENRGTMNKSLGEMSFDDPMTKGEMKEAMKGMTEDEKKDFQEMQNRGEIDTKKDMIDHAADVMTGKTSVADAASSAVSSAASAVGTAANAVASATVAMATGKDINVAQLAKEMSGQDKDYEEAKEQLLKEGEIDEMASGAEWSRDKDQKDKIRARATKNKSEREASSKVDKVVPEESDSLNLEREAEHQEEMQKIEDSDSSGAVKALKKMAQKASTAAKKIYLFSESRERLRDKVKERKGEMDSNDKIIEDSADAKMEVNNETIAELEGQREESMKTFRSAKAAVSKKRESIAKAKENYAKFKSEGKTKEASEEYAKMKKGERELAGSKEMKEYNDSAVEVHRIDAQIENKKSANKSLGKVKGNIADAREIRGSAKEAAKKSASEDKRASSRSAAHKEMAKKNPELMAKAGRAKDKIEENSKSRIPYVTGSNDGAMKAYEEAVESGDEAKVEEFVKNHGFDTEEEKLSKEVDKSFESAKSAEDFEKFVKKYQNKVGKNG